MERVTSKFDFPCVNTRLIY